MKLSQTFLIFSVLALLVIPSRSFSMEGVGEVWSDYQGRRAYQKQDYSKSVKKFENLLEKKQDPEIFFNLGAAQYRAKQFAAAEQSFNKAQETKDPSLKEKALYNLGNTMFRLNRPQESIQAYQKALEIHPQDEEARLNLEYVKKQLKSPESQQQPGESPQDKEGKSENKQEGDSEQKQTSTSPSDKGETPEQEKKEGKTSQSKEDQKEQGAPEPNKQKSGEEKAPKASPSNSEKTKEVPPPSPDQPQNPKEGSQGEEGKRPPEEKKNLEGKLEASGEPPPSKSGIPQPAQPLQKTPSQEEGERWLENIQDYSSEIRKQQVKETLGRSKTPGKDW